MEHYGMLRRRSVGERHGTSGWIPPTRGTPTTSRPTCCSTTCSDRDQIDRLLAARCPGCGYTYDVVTGDEREGFAAGTAWADVPDTWCCPDCGVRDKVDFVPVEASVVP